MTNGAKQPDDLAAQAGEYVLGLMSDAEREAFETRMASDPAIRGLVAAERERFLELDVTATGAQPGGGLWQRIEQGITNARSNVIDLEASTRARLQRANPVERASSRRSFWQGFATASILGLVLSGLAYMREAPQQPRLIVVLLNDQAQPVSIVEALSGQRIRVIPLGTINVPANRTLQVWTLPNPATGPVSMGLLDSVRSTLLEGPALPAPQPDQLYEITLEPAGGSPTGRPTGPIVGKGYARVPQI